jgi:hypothetical protein
MTGIIIENLRQQVNEDEWRRNKTIASHFAGEPLAL